jgi:RND family efflux transporter MFP subunit
VERRFVAAPLAGTLERAWVLPGAEVTAGQVLALLDGRELRWELAGLEAELGRVQKQQEVALVRQESAAAQQAGLELQRLELKRALLTHRLANLEIRSPTTGVVVSGDLSTSQHAPVETGQVLFEVAPLAAMSAELAVPEADASYVQPGQPVRLALEASPRTAWRGTIDSLRPRAEQRDGQNVLVAEVRIDNCDGQLRPGMSGRGRITCGDRLIGWILFHKPVEALCRLAGW